VLVSFFLCAVFSPLTALSLEELLHGYAEKDIVFKELHVKFMQSVLEEKRVRTDNGVNVTLSTGTINFVAEKDASFFSVTPEVKLAIPSLQNTVVNASFPFQANTVNGASSGGSGSSTMSGASVNVKSDIISSAAAKRAAAIENAARQTVLARRACEDRALEIEKNFWTELQALYQGASDSAKAQETLIASQKSFDTVKTQGYGASSSKYRLAELTVKSNERALEEKKRSFAAAFTDFALNCGKDADFFAGADIPVLPEDMRRRPLLSVGDFDPALFAPVEQAAWNYAYNEKLRKADIPFSVGAGASYAYKRTDPPQKGGRSAGGDTENTVGAELSAAWRGISATAGVSVDTKKLSSPRLSFSLGWDMRTFKNAGLRKDAKKFGVELDMLALHSAEENKKKREQTLTVKAADLTWQREKTSEELDLYRALYADMQKGFNDGVVSARDLLEAKTNFEQVLYKAFSVELDCLIYNIEVKRLFVQTEQLPET